MAAVDRRRLHEERAPAVLTTQASHPREPNIATTSHFETSATTTSPSQPKRTSRRLSPGLVIRLQKFEEHRRRKKEARRQLSIGRIPEEQLEELERLQGDRQVIDIRPRGTKWTGPSVQVMPSGGVRLSGGPVLTDNEASMLESDVSSVIDISDHFVASDTEDDAGENLVDTNKYRMPDIGKTRLHLRTKEPLSPNPRRGVTGGSGSPKRKSSGSVPSTPKTTQSTTNGNSPSKMEFPTNWTNNSMENVSDGDLVRPGLSRAGSIYTLGRASFTGQLAQLTSMRLPDSDSLAKRISSIPTSTEAAKALSDASDQIRMWISKASDVLDGLNAEDDVEWAAAGGREGIDDVDDAINRFERLVQVYIVSIERLQTREDISSLSADDLTDVVKQMEGIIGSWQKIKDTLKGVKDQVELAMEWEQLWNSFLGEIGQEMEALNQLVFEMEESRHQNTEGILSSKDTMDINELETIVEEHPGRGRTAIDTSRMNMQTFSPTSPAVESESNDREEGTLLGLFARMQPLRASLDFMPMRLSVFHVRANPTFPSACLDLENRQVQLEAQWKKLEADAESLRRELGEDRWIVVFRNAGRQALKMCESVTRSLTKLKDGIDAGEQQTNAPALGKKIESYEAKKTHYGPAIERVLAIIDRGVLDRLTVNGEILRLQSDMKRRWAQLQTEMRDLDTLVESINTSEIRDKQLRDSVSTVMSSERSLGSSFVETPGSSPASSVVGNSRKNSFHGSRTPTPLTTFKIRSSSRPSSLSSSIPRRTPLARKTGSDAHLTPNSSPATASTPSKTSPAWLARPEAPGTGKKPRWISTRQSEVRDFRPLSACEPSPYAKAAPTPKHNFLRASSHPTATVTPNPRATSSRVTSTPSTLPRPPSATAARKSTLPFSSSTAAASGNTSTSTTRRQSMLNLKSTAPTPRPSSRLTSGRRSSLLAVPSQPTDGNEADTESPSHHRRPPSALSGGRKSSLLPHRPRSRLEETTEKPKWRV